MQIEKRVRQKNIEQGMLEKIHLIPSQTNMQLGFCDKELGTLKYSRSKVSNARKKNRKTNRTICWAL